jgi:hypothetical protein
MTSKKIGSHETFMEGLEKRRHESGETFLFVNNFSKKTN